MGWLQSKVLHFLHHNLVFYQNGVHLYVITWHKNRIFLDLWLELDCQLEEEGIYKKMQHISPNI
jgi:hypothetical protein